MLSSRLLLSLFLAAAATVAVAKPPSPDPLDLSDFAASKARIERDLKDEKTYSELNRREREQVVSALGRMELTLEGVESLSDLGENARIALFNDQEIVTNLLTAAAEDSRLVCRREKSMGSHMTRASCRTVGEIRRAREAAESQMLEGSQQSQSLR